MKRQAIYVGRTQDDKSLDILLIFGMTGTAFLFGKKSDVWAFTPHGAENHSWLVNGEDLKLA